MRLDYSITIDEASLRNALLKGVAEQLNARAFRAKGRIQSRVKAIIERAIHQSPEAVSLQGGDLQGELGVVNPHQAIAAIVDALQTSMQVNVTDFKSTFSGIDGGIQILVSRKNLSDVLGIDEGSFHSEHGFQIDWLKWLLTAGDAIVVQDYHFAGGDIATFPTSRTGLGIMQRRGSWKVPPEFSGTEEDNWLSRALSAVSGEVVEALRAEMGV